MATTTAHHSPAPRDMVLLTTPLGHEVRAQWDYAHTALSEAKVVHTRTGVIRPLDAQTTETLARAMKARSVYEHALAETKAVEQTLKRFGKLAEALGNDHPALEPYFREAQQHRSIARDMFARARDFHDEAMDTIDRIVKD